MTNASSIQIVIDFSSINPDFQEEELDAFTRQLQNEIRDVADSVYRVRMSETPDNSKSALGSFILGVLKAEVTFKNTGALFNFLSTRFGDKPIELTVKASDGRELSLKASSRKDFEYGMFKAQEFFDQSQK